MRIYFPLLLIVGIFTAYLSCGNTANSQDAKKQYIVNMSFEKEISYKNVDLSDLLVGGPDGTWWRDTIIVENKHDTIMAMNDTHIYLQTYYWVCFHIAHKAPMDNDAGNENSPETKYLLKKIEILDSSGKNILPDIDFPDREEKEAAIWKEAQVSYRSYKDIPQPRIK